MIYNLELEVYLKFQELQNLKTIDVSINGNVVQAEVIEQGEEAVMEQAQETTTTEETPQNDTNNNNNDTDIVTNDTDIVTNDTDIVTELTETPVESATSGNNLPHARVQVFAEIIEEEIIEEETVEVSLGYLWISLRLIK